MLSPFRLVLRSSSAVRYHSTVKAINSFEAFKTEISSEKLTLVDFYATWCGPCKAISPYIEKLAKDYSNVNFHKVDVDEQPEIAGYCGISAMPTFIFFKDGASLGKVVGANLNEIRSVLQQHSGQPKN